MTQAYLPNGHALRPQTDAWLAAHDFDNLGMEIGKLTCLLEILDDVAITAAPSLGAGPETWSRYVARIDAIVEAMLAFSAQTERLASDYAAKLRAASAADDEPGLDRHAA